MVRIVMAIGRMKERRGWRRWLGLALWLVAVLLLPSARVFAQSGIEAHAVGYRTLPHRPGA